MHNRFRGVLPDEFGGMKHLGSLNVAVNHFAGALPFAMQGCSLHQFVYLSDNYFEGTIPTWISPYILVLHGNPLAGTIPPQILYGETFHGLKVIVASGMHHEGTIPACASRMSIPLTSLAFGHGLRGPLPSIPGTVELLSVWQNSLQGHLPELHITNSSKLFVHANDLSCKLPQNGW
eukprot:4588900-Amphidinium_carterae.1